MIFKRCFGAPDARHTFDYSYIKGMPGLRVYMFGSSPYSVISDVAWAFFGIATVVHSSVLDTLIPLSLTLIMCLTILSAHTQSNNSTPQTANCLVSSYRSCVSRASDNLSIFTYHLEPPRQNAEPISFKKDALFLIPPSTISHDVQTPRTTRYPERKKPAFLRPSYAIK